jgi:exoribonuclease R
VLAACAGVAPPEWAVTALPDLVAVMPRADQHRAAVARACVDVVEVALLSGHEGDRFRGTVVDRHRRGVVVMLADLPVVATVPGSRELGAAVTVRLEALDPVARTSAFVLQPR